MTGNATHQAAVMGAIAARTVSIDELAEALPIERKQISTAAGRLIRRGFLDRLETGLYQLNDAGLQALHDGISLRSGPNRGKRKHPLYRDTLQQRAWAALRLSSRFTIGDIATLAANSSDKNPEQSLQRYFLRLRQAGYLVELSTRQKGNAPSSNGFKQWRLIRDTGEASPRWFDKQKAFKDGNTREVFPCL